VAISLATFAIAVVALPRDAHEKTVLLIIGGALAASVASNVAIVWLALRPLAEIESTAARIWSGDVTARVPNSLRADRELTRVGEALNILLDASASDQKRIRELAAHVMRVADEERAQIARELHETCAQSLAALHMELSVVARETVDRSAAERLERLRRIAGAVLDEVRMLSHTVHPRVMDDLGLGAALQRLAHDAERSGSLRVELDVDADVRDLEPSVASVLYRVAQEAFTNAVRHAGAGTLRVRAGLSGEYARVEVGDDGVGFYPEDAGWPSGGEGLSNLRARLALLDGTLEVESALGRGTRVRARVPRQVKARTVTTSE
jgi:signal transduction histidine kinase